MAAPVIEIRQSRFYFILHKLTLINDLPSADF